MSENYQNQLPVHRSSYLFPIFLFLLLTCALCLNIVVNIKSINGMVNGGMPIIEIHLPPNMRRIGRFSLSAIRYMLGTITSVIKNANAKPKMIVHDNGFQN